MTRQVRFRLPDPVLNTGKFGGWVALDPADLRRTYAVWWEPGYQHLRLHAWLANDLPFWGLLAAAVELEVRDPEQTPYCARSSAPELNRVLTEVWPHQDVLATLP
jgi:hypothetical protein